MPTHYISKSSDRPWLDATIAREIFRNVAEQKLLRRAAGPRSNCDSVDWKPLEEVNIKKGEWEPRLQYYRHSKLHQLSIYACWRGCADTDNQVHCLHLPYKSKAHVMSVEDNMYEQTMLSAGLWTSSSADFGPRT